MLLLGARKFGPLSMNFKGKRVVIVDDSIVRGNTMGPIIKLLKQAGAQEVSSNSNIASLDEIFVLQIQPQLIFYLWKDSFFLRNGSTGSYERY